MSQAAGVDARSTVRLARKSRRCCVKTAISAASFFSGTENHLHYMRQPLPKAYLSGAIGADALIYKAAAVTLS